MALSLFFEKYRENGLIEAMISTKEIITEIEIEQKFQERWMVQRKKQFGENDEEVRPQFVKHYFRINYFVYLVDQVISSIKKRFEQFKNEYSLIGYCLNLKNGLKFGDHSDVDGLDLFLELKVFVKFYKQKRINQLKPYVILKKWIIFQMHILPIE